MRRLSLLLMLVAFSGCMNAYYNVWETLGKEKRDLLKDNVSELRQDQKDVSDQLKDALARLQAAYGSSNSQLESTYKNLEHDYQQSETKADALRDRVKRVERIADDLFAEWQNEIGEMHNAKYRADSRKKLAETKHKFDELRQSMHRSEKSLDPVLVTLHDQTLYLKHNLNAGSLDTLKSEAHSIEGGVKQLVADMQRSIAASNDFLGTLDSNAAVAH